MEPQDFQKLSAGTVFTEGFVRTSLLRSHLEDVTDNPLAEAKKLILSVSLPRGT
jgi:hypothetical protein